MQFFGVADSLAPAALPPFDHALALWQDGQHVAAKSVLEKILAKLPNHAEANNLLGVIYFEDDVMEVASIHFGKAIASRPEWAAPHNNLGNVFRHSLAMVEAERHYRAALACDPNYVEALTNLGVVLNFQGENESAEAYCKSAIELAPEFAGAHCNLGNVLLSLGRGGEAVAAYREALRLQPGIVEALVNLALVLQDNTYLAGTIDFYEKRLARKPQDYLANVRIAQALQALDRWDDARPRLKIALIEKPDAFDTLYILGVNFLSVGDIHEGRSYMSRVLAIGPNAMAQTVLIYYSMYLEDRTGEQLCDEYRQWADTYTTSQILPPVPLRKAQPERRIRIGYVSRDFNLHSVAYFVEPILTQRDRRRFEVFCYSTLIREDDTTARFKALADNWRDISLLSEDRVVSMIRADRIDILVDLSGHTLGNRMGVFAFKPAPIQVSYLGHPATTGLPAIDYRIGDAVTDPADLIRGHYVETLWRLPGCFLTYQPSANAPEVAPAPFLKRGFITFGSFNNGVKVNEGVIEVWARILTAVPSSRLLLKSFSFTSSHGTARVAESFARHGIDQARLDLVGWRPDVRNHLEMYGEIDIALDTFPYNGTTTTCEAFWMGVPVVCLQGSRHSARVGASLLAAVGMEELLAADAQEYVRLSVSLAGNTSHLCELRLQLRDKVRSSSLTDHAAFTRHLESAYLEMWNKYCQDRSNEEAAQHAGLPSPLDEGLPNDPTSGDEDLQRLHIGGNEPKPGWQILDITPGPGVDYVGDICNLSGFDSNSVAEIYASHVLEHVDQKSMPSVLLELHRILENPGGRLMISVPDLEVLCRSFLDKDRNAESRVHIMRMIFGGQVDAHDYHQIGLYYENLTALLTNAGFNDVRRVDSFGLFKDTSDYAPYGERISLNVVATV